jgi:cell division protease FtsH
MSASPIKRFRIASEATDFWQNSSSAERKSRDPSRVAASLMLQRALDAKDLTLAEAARDGCVTLVELHDDCWREQVLEEWHRFGRRGGYYQFGSRDRSYSRDPAWYVWAPESRPVASEVAEAAEMFAKAISRGEHILGIAADLAILPADLVQSADVRLSLSALSPTDVAMVVAELCGDEPTSTLTEEQTGSLTPRLLRLARRPDQTADQYVGKLIVLLDLEPKPAALAAAAHHLPPRTEPTLERLHGMPEAVAWGQKVARDVQLYRDGQIAWGDVDRGCLLSGPPGCGKTLFGRALATTCGMPLVIGSYGEWLGQGGGHQGDLLKGMRKSFAEAHAKVPSILFIDEIDSFPNRATVSSYYAEWETQVVNALLAEIDGAQNRQGVVLIGACNHPDKLDPALTRSGRLDRHFRIHLPNQSELERILREHLGDELAGEPLTEAALNAAGASGADVERFVRDARRRARDAGRPIVLPDLMATIGGEDLRTLEEKWLFALHEAGHAVASCVLEPGVLQAVSIRQSDRVAGRSLGSSSRAYFRLSDLQADLIVTLAGRASEEAVLGAPSSGSGGDATSDIGLATRLAMRAVAAFGFDSTSGLLWTGLPNAAQTPKTLAANPALAARVRTMLDEAYRKAMVLVVERRAAVEAVARALLEQRALDGEAVVNIVARYSVRPSTEPAS